MIPPDRPDADSGPRPGRNVVVTIRGLARLQAPLSLRAPAAIQNRASDPPLLLFSFPRAEGAARSPRAITGKNPIDDERTATPVDTQARATEQHGTHASGNAQRCRSDHGSLAGRKCYRSSKTQTG